MAIFERGVSALALLVLATLAANAHAITGKELVRNCEQALKADSPIASEDPYQAGQCLGFIEGYLAGAESAWFMAAKSEEDLRKAQFFCLPQNISKMQVIRTLHRMLKDEPKELDKPAPLLVIPALIAAYPCKGRQ